MWGMAKHIISRSLSAIRDIFWQKWWRKSLLVAYFVLALWDNGVRWLFPDKEWLTLSAIAPNWRWEYWVIIGLGLLLIITFVSVCRLQRNISSGNLILDYVEREGRLPELPQGLHALFPKYKSGELISRDLDATSPSTQFLRRISYNQPLVEFLFSLLAWQNKDPRSYIAGLTSMPIVYSGKNPREWARDFVSYWQNIISNERRNR
jgi:hypothetical protein